MNIAVTDANIFIDLIKLEKLHLLFDLEAQVVTTQEVVDQLNDNQFEQLNVFIDTYQLKVHQFSAEELTEVKKFDAPRALEFTDKTVLVIAGNLDADILTGDTTIRKYCIDKNISVKGMLWILDTFLEKGHIQKHEALTSLRKLMSFRNRLPAEECKERLERWGDEN